MSRAQRNLENDASVVASSAIENATADSSRNTVTAMVDAREEVLYAKAAAKLIRADDAMSQALLDVHA
jgi:hypothetical protein